MMNGNLKTNLPCPSFQRIITSPNKFREKKCVEGIDLWVIVTFPSLNKQVHVEINHLHIRENK